MRFSTPFIVSTSFGSLARAANLLAALGGTNAPSAAQQSGCTPFTSTFPASDVSSDFYTPFISISPEGTYEATGDGLTLFLTKPDVPINRTGHVNSALGQGATINSTFLLSCVLFFFSDRLIEADGFSRYGKVTYRVAAPRVAGSVTAVIMIGG